MKWISSSSSASHHGGVWERCIRTVRKVTKAVLNKQPLDEEGLATILWEIEAIINGRPLTKVSDDPRDPEALILNHLLLLCSGPAPLPGIFPKEDCYSRRTWWHVSFLADIFWWRWTREYLPSLQQRKKSSHISRKFAVGDVVLTLDENTPRSSWPLGRILEIFPNQSDGLLRSVKLRTKSSALVRHIGKIVLLAASWTVISWKRELVLYLILLTFSFVFLVQSVLNHGLWLVKGNEFFKPLKEPEC